MAPWMSRAHVCPTPLETSATCIPSGTMTGFALDSTGVSPCYRSCFFDVILDNGAADQYLNLFQHFRRPMEVPVPQCISRHPREPCYFATGSIGHALRGSAELPGFLRFRPGLTDARRASMVFESRWGRFASPGNTSVF